MSKWYPKLACGSPTLAAWRYRAMVERFDENHPAALGALGKWRALVGHVPGRLNDITPDLVAWHRAWHAGTDHDHGYMNRAHRKAIARRTT